MKTYDKLLENAFEKMPKRGEVSDRFKLPRARILPAGARTIITNFVEIANTLRRKPGHLQKFLLKELATSGEMNGNRLVVQGRFRSGVVDKKIELYAKSYVLCPECGKPDTKFVKEDRHIFIKCEACGSRNIIKKV